MKLTRCFPRSNADMQAHFEQSGFPSLDRGFNYAEGGEGEPDRLPRTNVTETENGYVLSVEMPGVGKKHVELSVDGDQLIIKGEKSETVEGKGALRREFRSARFERSFTLGKGIDKENVKARMDDGVLTVTLHNAVDPGGHRVEIE